MYFGVKDQGRCNIMSPGGVLSDFVSFLVVFNVYLEGDVYSLGNHSRGRLSRSHIYTVYYMYVLFTLSRGRRVLLG